MNKIISFKILIPNFIPSENIGMNGLGIIYGNIGIRNDICNISASVFMHNASVKNNCVFIVTITMMTQSYQTIHQATLKIDTTKSYMLASNQRFLGETSFYIPSGYRHQKLKVKMSTQCIYDSGSGLVTNWFPSTHTEEIIIE